MNALKRLILAGAGCCVAGLFPLFASEREVIDLSASSWNITLDRDAAWQNETLYLPPVDIRTLPVNEPTGSAIGENQEKNILSSMRFDEHK
ncbi:hypothetical protein [Phocaeicola salanitronis]|uniref:hypothetical protein n=1 Tax=Phocaeicola salanitronis TaxID=376805 RepID=UPI0002FC8AD2|nr:hypothetical protein [Phocaeicola salanitronis]